MQIADSIVTEAAKLKSITETAGSDLGRIIERDKSVITMNYWEFAPRRPNIAPA